MKQFKGTKGEWEATYFGLATHGKTKVFSHTENDLGFGKYICDTYGNSNSYLPECEANAKLIASAPDLLKALQDLLDNHIQLVSCGDCGNWDVETEKEVIQARKAIDKAL